MSDVPKVLKGVSLPKRQDSLTDQLADVHYAAIRLGCYDAADWIREYGPWLPPRKEVPQ